MKFNPSISNSLRRYNQFDAVSTAFELAFEKPLVPRIGLTGGLSYTLERTRQFNAANADDNATLTIGTISPSLTYDRRDHPLVPTRGTWANASIEFAFPYFGSQSDVSYIRSQFWGDQFVPIGRRFQLYLSLRTGFERNLGSRIPLSKQFALGGIGSLRGFKFQELNVQTQNITGYLTYVNYRGQLDFAATDVIRFGPFLDAGNLFVNAYSLTDLRWSSGFGLHLQTPVAPVNFDIGFKLDPKPGESTWEFYFSVGIL
jgi:outer membrane protein insertion porin family